MTYYYCRCQCGNCVNMLTNHECICCCELGFESMCLDVWVLQAAYFSYRYHYGDAEEKVIHE